MNTIFWKFLRFSLFIYLCSADAGISDKRLCVDPECKSPISFAKTLRTYFSPDEYRLSFGPNENVVIYSKSAGSNEDLWGAEIRGKRGYIPKSLVRETKMLNKPNTLVDTEVKSIQKAEVPLKSEVLSPSKVKQNFEVFDGTTLYLDDQKTKNETETTTYLAENSKTPNELKVENEKVEITEEVIPSDNLSKSVDSEIKTESEPTSDTKTSKNDTNSTEEIDESDINELDTANHSNASTENSVSNESNEIFNDKIVDSQSEEKVDADVSNKVEDTNENIKPDQERNLDEENEMANLNGIDSKSNLFDEILISTDVSNDSNDAASLNNSQIEPDIVSSEFVSNFDLKFLNPSKGSQQNSASLSTLEKKDSPSLSNNESSEVNIDINNSETESPSSIGAFTTESPSSIDASTNESPSNIDASTTEVPSLIDNFENKEQMDIKTINPVNEEPSIVEDSSMSNKSLENDLKSADISTDSTNFSDENFSTDQNELGTKEIIPQENYSQNVSTKKSFTTEPDGIISNDNELLNQNIETTLDSNNNPPGGVDVAKPSFPEENHPQENKKEQHSVYNTGKSDNELAVTDDQQTHNINTFNSEYSHNEAEENNKFIETNTNFFSFFNEEKEEQLPPKDESPPILPYSSVLNNDNHMNEESVGGSKFSQEDDFCTKESCPNQDIPEASWNVLQLIDMLSFNSDVLVFLVTTAVSVLIFLLGHFALDKSRRERPLIVKINKLEKEFLILLKEKELLAVQLEDQNQQNKVIENDYFANSNQENKSLKEKVQQLEEQIQTLEKELENSTEVGLELNRMLSDVLNSENAGQTIMLNIEELQSQLTEQENIVSNMKEVLSLKETENHEITLELDIANKKMKDLQSEVDKLLLNIIKLEEDKETLKIDKESKLIEMNEIVNTLEKKLAEKDLENSYRIKELNEDLSTMEHDLQLKSKEYEGLKKSMEQIKEMKNANTFESLLEVNSIKAELEQIKADCQSHCEKLQKEKDANCILEKKVKSAEEEMQVSRTKFDETDKAKLELETKLQVLTNYFKDREEQLQKEISKYESLWSTKQGEATSTSERIKYLQSEAQNYKSQNETLKQEIVSQEVELKGQISVLEKKVHENWVSARQAERRLEELKQEAAQLRNRLTLRERALQEDRLHNRMQSPLEQNEDIPISPMHLESPASPPPLYNSREHVTKSPPILGMPPPFLPPPSSGAPFLPPPPLPFMGLPPHDMFPGDHRPPPLGRMSSPPLNSRYSPNRIYSPYDRSPSPSYDESEYGTSPVHRRNFSQYNRRRDHRSSAMDKFNGRSGTLSSGSDNSNESLEEINRQNSKV